MIVYLVNMCLTCDIPAVIECNDAFEPAGYMYFFRLSWVQNVQKYLTKPDEYLSFSSSHIPGLNSPRAWARRPRYVNRTARDRGPKFYSKYYRILQGAFAHSAPMTTGKRTYVPVLKCWCTSCHNASFCSTLLYYKNRRSQRFEIFWFT